MIWVSLSRLVGTLLAQALLVPAAVLIAYAAAGNSMRLSAISMCWRVSNG